MTAGCTSCSSSGGNFALARLNANGSIDLTFGGDGTVTTDFAGDDDQALTIAIQVDGKIVAAGTTVLSTFDPRDFAVARYNPDGSLDAGFDGDGKVTTDFGNGAQARGMALQREGKIVAAGIAVESGTQNFGLARYNADGSLDTTFSSDGKVMTDFSFANDQAFAVAVQGTARLSLRESRTATSPWLVTRCVASPRGGRRSPAVSSSYSLLHLARRRR